MNNLIGSKELLAQLDRLKSLVRDFAAREQKLNTAFRDQSAKDASAFEVALAAIALALFASAAAPQPGFQTGKLPSEAVTVPSPRSVAASAWYACVSVPNTLLHFKIPSNVVVIGPSTPCAPS